MCTTTAAGSGSYEITAAITSKDIATIDPSVWVSNAANKELMKNAFLAKTAVTEANGGQALTGDDVKVITTKLSDDDASDDGLGMAVIGAVVGGGVVFIIFIVVAIVGCRRN